MIIDPRPTTHRKEANVNPTMLGLLRRSLEDGFSVVLYLPHQTVALIVTSLVGAETVVGYNQDFDEVQVRLDAVYAVGRG